MTINRVMHSEKGRT